MKLAEALQERADLQKRIAQLSRRLDNNARVHQGEKPAEDPVELLRELDECIERLEYLIAAINRTNSVTISEGESLSTLIARRDCMRKKISILQDFLQEASVLTSRSYRTEIIVKSTVSVYELRKKVDLLSRDLRTLDLRIQQQNWLSDLI